MNTTVPHATHVATLVCNPTAPVLDEAIVAAALSVLPEPGAAAWLNPGVAVDLFFSGPRNLDPKTMTTRIRSILAHAPIDIIVQPVEGRRKMLFLADMDSTMIGQECIDELADFAGFKAEVSAITERAMNGEIAFEPALRERVALLRGLSTSIVAEIVETRLTLTAGGAALVRTMRANGAYTCLVSGGFTLFTQRIAAMIGFDEHRANVLLTEGETFSGDVARPHSWAGGKTRNAGRTARGAGAGTARHDGRRRRRKRSRHAGRGGPRLCLSRQGRRGGDRRW